MAFSKKVSEKALLSCARHCCLCHKFCGVKIELHHIKQKAEGGKDTFENCVPLCFDCHAEVMSYNPKHPKGRKFTDSELRKIRDQWYARVINRNILEPPIIESKIICLEKDVNFLLEKIKPDFSEITIFSDSVNGDANNKEASSSQPISTGLRDLDTLIGGLYKSELMVVASTPSIGKSNFALTIAKNVGMLSKERVAIFSLESTLKRIAENLLASIAKVDKNRIQSGSLDSEEIDKIAMAIEELSTIPLFIDETSNNVEEIIEKSIKVKPKLIIVDNMNLLIDDVTKSEFESNTSNIKKLKKLAKKLECSIIVLVALSPIKRLDPRPYLIDLDKLGDIESIADIIVFLHQTIENDINKYKKSILEVFVAKNRHGPVGKIELAHLKEYGAILTLAKQS